MGVGADFVVVHVRSDTPVCCGAQAQSRASVFVRMRLRLRAGGASGTVGAVGGMVPRLTKGNCMAHYLVIGGSTGRRFSRHGRPVEATAEEAKIPAISLASLAAHIVSKNEKERASVWKIEGGREAEVAVYFPEIKEGGAS